MKLREGCSGQTRLVIVVGERFVIVSRDRGGENCRERDRRKAVFVIKPHKTCGGSKPAPD
jgi:hypothetical protein